MSYEAIVYNVMIASPSDVNDERQTIREAIFDWNYKHSIPTGKVLIPLGWETHSAPLLGEVREERPQAVINDMVLKHADVLVAIFKTRIGSPTGKAASGTIEEINLHHSLGKYVLLYFGKQTGSISEQDEAVQTYKEACKKKGCICEYSDCRELKEKFYGHLQLLANILKAKGQKLIPESRIIGIPGASLAVIEGSVSVVNEKTKILLAEILQDPKGQICVLKLVGEQVKIETNGGKFFGFEDVLKHLERSQWIKRLDSDDRIFSLTDLGHQEAAKLKGAPA